MVVKSQLTVFRRLNQKSVVYKRRLDNLTMAVSAEKNPIMTFNSNDLGYEDSQLPSS